MRLRIGLIAPLVLACSLAAPGPTTQATNPPTAVPTVAPTAPRTAVPTAEQVDQPPAALLAADSDPVAGWLGTFCWHGACLDAPQLPAKSELPILNTDARAELTLTLADGTQFSEWSAVYATDSEVTGTELGGGGAPYDPYSSATPPAALDSATFAAPPTGDWMIRVFVGFSDGDASYAWHVSVT